MSTSDYNNISKIAKGVVDTLQEKGLHYGDSWKSRGGVGAFMMMARKWDRVENIAKSNKYDIFEALLQNKGDVRDDLLDLVGYLLLTLDEVERKAATGGKTPRSTAISKAFTKDDPLLIKPHPLMNECDARDAGLTIEGYYGDGRVMYTEKATGRVVISKTVAGALQGLGAAPPATRV